MRKSRRELDSLAVDELFLESEVLGHRKLLNAKIVDVDSDELPHTWTGPDGNGDEGRKNDCFLEKEKMIGAREGGGGRRVLGEDLGGFEDFEERAVFEHSAMVFGHHVGELVKKVVRLKNTFPLAHVPLHYEEQ